MVELEEVETDNILVIKSVTAVVELEKVEAVNKLVVLESSAAVLVLKEVEAVEELAVLESFTAIVEVLSLIHI